MAQYLDFDTQTAANPWAAYPAGWQRTSPTLVQISTSSSIELFSRSGGTSGQIGCVVNSTAFTGNNLYAKRVHPANATAAGSTSQCIMHNSSGNGYVLEQDQVGTTTTFKLVIAYVVQTTALQTFTSYGTGYDQAFELRCIDKSAGTFQFLRNGVQVGNNFTDTTYTDLEYAGASGTGGRTRSIEVGEIQDFLTITDPITLGSSITATTNGFSTVTSITGAGMSANNVVFNSGITTADWPALSESIAPTVLLPAAGVTITLSDSITSRTRTSNINLPVNMVSTPLGVLIADAGYLASVYTLESNWTLYYDNTQLNGMIIYPDSRIDVTIPGTFVCWVHKIGDGNVLEQLTVNITNTLVIIDLTSWIVQSDSPFFDGQYHHSVRL